MSSAVSRADARKSQLPTARLLMLVGFLPKNSSMVIEQPSFPLTLNQDDGLVHSAVCLLCNSITADRQDDTDYAPPFSVFTFTNNSGPCLWRLCGAGSMVWRVPGMAV